MILTKCIFTLFLASVTFAVPVRHHDGEHHNGVHRNDAEVHAHKHNHKPVNDHRVRDDHVSAFDALDHDKRGMKNTLEDLANIYVNYVSNTGQYKRMLPRPTQRPAGPRPNPNPRPRPLPPIPAPDPAPPYTEQPGPGEVSLDGERPVPNQQRDLKESLDNFVSDYLNRVSVGNEKRMLPRPTQRPAGPRPNPNPPARPLPPIPHPDPAPPYTEQPGPGEVSLDGERPAPNKRDLKDSLNNLVNEKRMLPRPTQRPAGPRPNPNPPARPLPPIPHPNPAPPYTEQPGPGEVSLDGERPVPNQQRDLKESLDNSVNDKRMLPRPTQRPAGPRPNPNPPARPLPPIPHPDPAPPYTEQPGPGEVSLDGERPAPNQRDLKESLIL